MLLMLSETFPCTNIQHDFLLSSGCQFLILAHFQIILCIHNNHNLKISTEKSKVAETDLFTDSHSFTKAIHSRTFNTYSHMNEYCEAFLECFYRNEWTCCITFHEPLRRNCALELLLEPEITKVHEITRKHDFCPFQCSHFFSSPLS